MNIDGDKEKDAPAPAVAAAVAPLAVTYPIPVFENCKLPLHMKLVTGEPIDDSQGMNDIFGAIDPLSLDLMNSVEAITVVVGILDQVDEKPETKPLLVRSQESTRLH